MSQRDHAPQLFWNLAADPTLTGPAKLVWLMLWTRWMMDRLPSLAELAADCCLTELAVQEALKLLDALQWVRDDGDGYRPCLPYGTRRLCPVPKGIRFAVLRRDSFTCRYCGRAAPDVWVEVDHVIPQSAGGPTTMDNLVTACGDCNSGKGTGPARDVA